MNKNMGKVIIFSAPSGSGKTTLVRELLKRNEFDFGFSISTTSRAPRGEEQHGKEYYFISASEFKEKIANGDFLEWEEVYADHFYGTTKAEITRLQSAGKVILFDIDVFGGINVKKYFQEKALSLFIQPPSIAILRHRLEARNTDSPEKIAMRLEKASQEIEQAQHFDKIIINDDLETAVQELLAIVRDFLK